MGEGTEHFLARRKAMDPLSLEAFRNKERLAQWERRKSGQRPDHEKDGVAVLFIGLVFVAGFAFGIGTVLLAGWMA